MESELPAPPARQAMMQTVADEPNAESEQPSASVNGSTRSSVAVNGSQHQSAAHGRQLTFGLRLSVPGEAEEEAADAESQPIQTRESKVSLTETVVSGHI